MDSRIEKIRNFRQFLLQQIAELTVEQLNSIPAGFHNNIIWNLGHMIAAEQNLCYVRSGLPIKVDDKYFSIFLSGTTPGKFLGAEEIGIIKELFITTIDLLGSDYDKKVFKQYEPSHAIQKVYGIAVERIEDAIEYLLHHEGFHAGYITTMKHLV